MQDGNIEILDLDFEYKLWKKKLQYFRTEIKLMQRRVEVLCKEHPKFECSENHKRALLEQIDIIDKTENKIKTLEQEISHYAVDYPISTKHLHYQEHEKMRSEIDKVIQLQLQICTEVLPTLCYPL